MEETAEEMAQLVRRPIGAVYLGLLISAALGTAMAMVFCER